MTARLGLGAWLVTLWVVLWGQVSFANVASGVVVAVGVLVLLIPVRRPDADSQRTRTALLTVRPLPATRFVFWTAGQVVISSLRVGWEVITPKNSIAMGVVRVPLRGISDAHTAIVANVITLTPGTISLDVTDDPTVLDVHVLHLVDPEEIVRSTQELERRVVEAFGSREARAAFEASEAGS